MERSPASLQPFFPDCKSRSVSQNRLHAESACSKCPANPEKIRHKKSWAATSCKAAPDHGSRAPARCPEAIPQTTRSRSPGKARKAANDLPQSLAGRVNRQRCRNSLLTIMLAGDLRLSEQSRHS